MRSPEGARKEEMKRRDITPEDMDWAVEKMAQLWELVARQLARVGEPELAARLRAWR